MENSHQDMGIRKHSYLTRLCAGLTVLVFTFSLILPSGVVWAQVMPAGAALPAVGSLLPMSKTFTPALLHGMTIKPDNPLAFDFIVNKGDTTLEGEALTDEGERLIKYFLATLTIPEDDLWVNLSPYEADRIIPEELSHTAMGREMLMQDYMLKQLTASMMVPDEELGGQFWQRVYQRAQAEYGTTDIPMNTFNKVWIIPQTAEVYEHENTVVVVNSHLKVMLEEDFLALEHHQARDTAMVTSQDKIVSGLTSEVVRELLIPEIEKEVNTGATFASLRQVYNSMILATWYKQAIKGSLLHQLYVDQHKISGVDIDDKEMKNKIYAQYIEAFQKGVVNIIKEEPNLVSGELMPRKYFSGGEKFLISKIINPVSSPLGKGVGTFLNNLLFSTQIIESNPGNNKVAKAMVKKAASEISNFKIFNAVSSSFKDLIATVQETFPDAVISQLTKDGPEGIVYGKQNYPKKGAPKASLADPFFVERNLNVLKVGQSLPLVYFRVADTRDEKAPQIVNWLFYREDALEVEQILESSNGRLAMISSGSSTLFMLKKAQKALNNLKRAESDVIFTHQSILTKAMQSLLDNQRGGFMKALNPLTTFKDGEKVLMDFARFLMDQGVVGKYYPIDSIDDVSLLLNLVVVKMVDPKANIEALTEGGPKAIVYGARQYLTKRRDDRILMDEQYLNEWSLVDSVPLSWFKIVDAHDQNNPTIKNLFVLDQDVDAVQSMIESDKNLSLINTSRQQGSSSIVDGMGQEEILEVFQDVLNFVDKQRNFNKKVSPDIVARHLFQVEGLLKNDPELKRHWGMFLVSLNNPSVNFETYFNSKVTPSRNDKVWQQFKTIVKHMLTAGLLEIGPSESLVIPADLYEAKFQGYSENKKEAYVDIEDQVSLVNATASSTLASSADLRSDIIRKEPVFLFKTWAQQQGILFGKGYEDLWKTLNESSSFDERMSNLHVVSQLPSNATVEDIQLFWQKLNLQNNLFQQGLAQAPVLAHDGSRAQSIKWFQPIISGNRTVLGPNEVQPFAEALGNLLGRLHQLGYAIDFVETGKANRMLTPFVYLDDSTGESPQVLIQHVSYVHPINQDNTLEENVQAHMKYVSAYQEVHPEGDVDQDRVLIAYLRGMKMDLEAYEAAKYGPDRTGSSSLVVKQFLELVAYKGPEYEDFLNALRLSQNALKMMQETSIKKNLKSLLDIVLKSTQFNDARKQVQDIYAQVQKWTQDIGNENSEIVVNYLVEQLKEQGVIQEDEEGRLTVAASVQTIQKPAKTGGIDFNSGLLDLQIKRDGNGIPLPVAQQPMGDIHIEGFFPVILNVAPINLPLLLGLRLSQPTDGQLSATFKLIPRERFATREEDWV